MPAKADVVFELLELCEDLLTSIDRQLLYYRASVYKEETVATIGKEINRLRHMLALFGDENLLEPLADYQAMNQHNLKLSPGECSFSRRIAILIANTRKQLQRYTHNGHPHNLTSSHIRGQRDYLLSLCPQGSRQWNFFRSL